MRRYNPRARAASGLSPIHGPYSLFSLRGATEDPFGIVRTALRMWRLAPRVVGESR